MKADEAEVQHPGPASGNQQKLSSRFVDRAWYPWSNLVIAFAALIVAIISVVTMRSIWGYTKELQNATNQLAGPNILRAQTYSFGVGKDDGSGSVMGCTHSITVVNNNGRTDTSIINVRHMGNLHSAMLDPSTGSIQKGVPFLIPAGQVRFILADNPDESGLPPGFTQPGTAVLCPVVIPELTQLGDIKVIPDQVDADTSGYKFTLERFDNACPSGVSSCVASLEIASTRALSLPIPEPV